MVYGRISDITSRFWQANDQPIRASAFLARAVLDRYRRSHGTTMPTRASAAQLPVRTTIEHVETLARHKAAGRAYRRIDASRLGCDRLSCFAWCCASLTGTHVSQDVGSRPSWARAMQRPGPLSIGCRPSYAGRGGLLGRRLNASAVAIGGQAIIIVTRWTEVHHNS